MKSVFLVLFLSHTILGQTRNSKIKDERPFYPDPFFSVKEPNMTKHQTAGYGDYRYFDNKYEYTINMDFYRYGATAPPDYDVDPSSIAYFVETHRKLVQYWAHYKYFYRIRFGSKDDDKKSFHVFRENIKSLKYLSEEIPTANFRINQFTHLSYSEFIANFTGFYNDNDGEDLADSYEIDIDEYPAHLDWSVYNNKTTLPPIIQTECSDSFVHSAINNIELKLLIDDTVDEMEYLSIQQGWDCSEPKIPCETGGGKPHYVFRGLQQTLGVQPVHIDHQAGLLYNLTCQWHDDEITKPNSTTIALATIVDWGVLTVKNEFELMLALNEYGPLSTAIFVTDAIKNYHSGILTEKYCENGEPNHAVLITGYAQDDDRVPYWIIKNSWGPNWGENGFLFLIRNKGACGIGQYLSYVYVKSSTTTTTTTIPTTATTPTTPCDPRVNMCGGNAPVVFESSDEYV